MWHITCQSERTMGRCNSIVERRTFGTNGRFTSLNPCVKRPIFVYIHVCIYTCIYMYVYTLIHVHNFETLPPVVRRLLARRETRRCGRDIRIQFFSGYHIISTIFFLTTRFYFCLWGTFWENLNRKWWIVHKIVVTKLLDCWKYKTG